MIVSDITCNPADPKGGDKVILSAVVKNIGTAPTPEGVIIGVEFKADGKVVGWSDNVNTALAPAHGRLHGEWRAGLDRRARQARSAGLRGQYRSLPGVGQNEQSVGEDDHHRRAVGRR